jgi:nucleoid-associated protein YgaU
MTTIVSLLKQNVELEKKAYSEYVKEMTSAGIQVGVKAGIPFEKAATLVKEACASSEELEFRSLNFTLMEKAAEEIEAKDAHIAELEKSAAKIAHKATASEPINKLAQLGFSEAELDALEGVDSNLLQKVANSASAPVGMGSGVGMAIEKMDPLLAFLVG